VPADSKTCPTTPSNHLTSRKSNQNNQTPKTKSNTRVSPPSLTSMISSRKLRKNKTTIRRNHQSPKWSLVSRKKRLAPALQLRYIPEKCWISSSISANLNRTSSNICQYPTKNGWNCKNSTKGNFIYSY